MKSMLITVMIAGAAFFFNSCSSSQEPDPEIEACKAACIKKTEVCIKKAAKNEAKKAACEAVGDKCIRDCGKKK